MSAAKKTWRAAWEGLNKVGIALGIGATATSAAFFPDLPAWVSCAVAFAGFYLGYYVGYRAGSTESDETDELRKRLVESSGRIADLKAENKELTARLQAALGASGAGRERPAEQARDVDGHLAVCDAGLSLLDRDMARAALAILGGERVRVGGEWEGAIRRSIDRRDWFFQPGYGVFMGMVDRDSPTGTYIIRDVWRRYLSVVGPRRLLEARASIGEGD